MATSEDWLTECQRIRRVDLEVYNYSFNYIFVTFTFTNPRKKFSKLSSDFHGFVNFRAKLFLNIFYKIRFVENIEKKVVLDFVVLNLIKPKHFANLILAKRRTGGGARTDK